MNRNTRSQMASAAAVLLSQEKVAALFDDMADEYDQIKDLWYAWLFSRLHYLLATSMARYQESPKLRCLDVGCGTGFQTILLSLCGHDVEGIDVSAGLVEKARKKSVQEFLDRDLFESPYSFGRAYSRRIRELATRIRGNRVLGGINYQLASATELPFPDGVFDLVNCCGSTLSFIVEYQQALHEIARVLRPGGHAFVEFESKYNVDLLWPVIDSCLLRDRIGYGQGKRETLRNLFSRRSTHVKIEFPFTTHTAQIDMPIWLFSSARLLKEFRTVGIEVKRIHGIHNLTNLIPSVVLDEPSPPSCVVRSFHALAKLEEIVGSWPVLRRLGCSTVFVGRKA